MTSPLKPLSQLCSNFIWSLLRSKAMKDCEDGPGPLTKMPAMPIYGKKNVKNLFLQSLGTLSAHRSSGMGVLPKLPE